MNALPMLKAPAELAGLVPDPRMPEPAEARRRDGRDAVGMLREFSPSAGRLALACGAVTFKDGHIYSGELHGFGAAFSGLGIYLAGDPEGALRLFIPADAIREGGGRPGAAPGAGDRRDPHGDGHPHAGVARDGARRAARGVQPNIGYRAGARRERLTCPGPSSLLFEFFNVLD
jgi:hypothetical protein